MNRLQAARQIKYDLFSNDGSIHFTRCHDEDGRNKIYSRNTSDSTYTESNWKEALKFIRENYPRREADTCCNHKYEVWSDSGNHLLMKVNCVLTHTHIHCVCCGNAEAAAGKLCDSCVDNANKKRREITAQIMNYEAYFNIKFHEWDEWREDYYEDDYGPDTLREDFHADG